MVGGRGGRRTGEGGEGNRRGRGGQVRERRRDGGMGRYMGVGLAS